MVGNYRPLRGVFAGEVIPSIILDSLIALLIAHLGHDSYWQRERAYRALAVLAPLATEQLERASKDADPEVRQRAWTLYRPMHEQRMEKVAFALRGGEMPWLHLHDSYELHYWIEQAEKQYSAPGVGPDWPNYRMAAKLWAKGRLLAGWTVGQVNGELERMAEEEKTWRARYISP